MNDEEYKKIKSSYNFGKIRFILWAVLAYICFHHIDTSMWSVIGGVFFGIILFIDMIITGLGMRTRQKKMDYIKDINVTMKTMINLMRISIMKNFTLWNKQIKTHLSFKTL